MTVNDDAVKYFLSSNIYQYWSGVNSFNYQGFAVVDGGRKRLAVNVTVTTNLTTTSSAVIWAWSILLVNSKHISFHFFFAQVLHHSDPVPSSNHERCACRPRWNWKNRNYKRSGTSAWNHGVCV